MDLAFFRRAQQGFAGRSAAGLDYRVLVASLDALQGASAAARAEQQASELCPDTRAAAHPLAEILLGGEGWRDAVAAQRGCFNPVAAMRRRNGV